LSVISAAFMALGRSLKENVRKCVISVHTMQQSPSNVFQPSLLSVAQAKNPEIILNFFFLSSPQSCQEIPMALHQNICRTGPLLTTSAPTTLIQPHHGFSPELPK
jgi:hypothetical protein